jgi:acyl transferase domain-containing protein/D-arabinose 1-dehydrogenase-like Zn-dependent alcohol dehydrogenase/acyl carrier protein
LSDDRLRDLLRRTVSDLRTARVRLGEAERREHEPIAIVGMACRFPGQIRSPRDLWRLVTAGRDVIGPFPTDRGWDIDGIYDTDPDRPGKTYTRRGGFVHDASSFDADFFGISPREAQAMDPQQRMLLEIAWQVVEGSDFNPDNLRGTPVGVFIGLIAQHYGQNAAESVGAHEGFLFTGNTPSVASGRIAYALGLQGPAVTVDTACSSSLVAIHLACRSLRQGECGLALTGGATIMATPAAFTEFSRQRALSPDGLCKAFAAGADGTGWGEGAGMLLLERLSDAERAGHQVLALIRGSAVNQDGASNGLTAPHGPSQQRVIRQALADARLSTAEVDAVEAHGTGTVLGDPIEAQALLATYGEDRPDGRPLWLGSVKSNIGHTAAAAGVAGVIKMVEAIREGVLPRTLHVDEPSPHVDWSTGSVSLLTEQRDWPETGRPRRAGVSSFGISGTNAHLILEQAPGLPSVPGTASEASWDAPVVAVPVSAKSEQALSAQAACLHEYLRATPELGLGDTGFTLATNRAQFDHRAVVVSADRRELLSGLQALSEGRSVPHLIRPTGLRPAGRPGKTVFVFPGQEGQHAGMAAALYRACPPFRDRIDACAEALVPHVGWSLAKVLLDPKPDTWLSRVDVVQPTLFAVMVALADLWRSFGVQPDAVIGHSQGEIAAAYVAGALSLQDAARVVALRSQALTDLTGRGGMMTVALGAEQAETRLAAWPGELTIAAVNGPASIVLSGGLQELDTFSLACQAEGIRTHLIPVDYAAHSPHVDTIADRLLTDLDGITPRQASVPLYSTVTAQVLHPAELGTDYWHRNLRQPVRFEPAIHALLADGHTVFIETSPHPVLTSAIEQITELVEHEFDGHEFVVNGTLRRDREDAHEFVTALARLHVHGAPVQWSGLFDQSLVRRADLPGYPFQRQPFWIEPSRSTDVTTAGLETPSHPLLGAAVALPDGGVVFTGRLSQQDLPWLADHAVAGVPLLPGTAFVGLALHAGGHVGCPRVDELTLESPLPIREGDEVQLRVTVEPADSAGHRSITIHTRPRGTDNPQTDDSMAWVKHADGTLVPGEPAVPVQNGPWPPPGCEPIDISQLYERLFERGYEYGPAFRGLQSAWRQGDDIYAEVGLPDSVDVSGFELHPALLDAALHAAALADVDGSTTGFIQLPFSFKDIALHGTGATAARVHLAKSGRGTLGLALTDSAGKALVTLGSLVTQPIPVHRLMGGTTTATDLYRLDWTRVPWSSEVAGTGLPGIAAAVLGEDGSDLTELLTSGSATVPVHHELTGLVVALAAGAPPPDLVLQAVPATSDDLDPARAAQRMTGRTLSLLQSWLAEPLLADSRLVLVTRGAVAAASGEHPTDLAAAAVWGLVRSVQFEEPDRIAIADLAPGAVPPPGTVLCLLDALRRGEPQLVVRADIVLAPKLARMSSTPGLVVPGTESWRLAVHEEPGGDQENLVLTPCPEVTTAPLAAGQVRLQVRAAGLNFHDVLEALGVISTGEPLGDEAAGVVCEIGPGAPDLTPGDRVMGLSRGAFGPVVVTDHRLLVPIPDGWTYAQAAGVPVAFLTAYHGLVDLAALQPGERVLIHSATGGVGMAALQLARRLSADVYATASPGKQHILRSLGLADDRIGSSRTLEFEEQFRASAGDQGFDVVLNSLAHEFTDASLRLLAGRGRFIEMGKTDIRDPEEISAAGIEYRVFDLHEAGVPRLSQILHQILDLLRRGELQPLPVSAWDIRYAPEVFRRMSQSRHTGKNVLTLPVALNPHGTVLITGGTGALGSLIARHFVHGRGLRHLILASRTGPNSDQARKTETELADVGATVTTVSCDTADPRELAQLLATVPAEHPLTAVIHCAGVLDDALVADLTPEKLQRVLRPKAAAAWNLHRLTQHLDLAEFTLFSSLAGTLGNPGQGNYAAANAFLDALAQFRVARGLPALSIAWGLWSAASTMAGQADSRLLARRGVAPLSDEQGKDLFDAASAHGLPSVIAARLDLVALRGQPVAPLLRGLVDVPIRPPATIGSRGTSFSERLASLGQDERRSVVLDRVRGLAASVLGHSVPGDILPDLAFKDQSFDSLTSVEFRNRLNQATGLRLPTTLAFDHPTPVAVTEHLLRQIVGTPPGETVPRAASQAVEPIAIIGMGCRYPGDVRSPGDLWRLVASGTDAIKQFPTDRGWDLEGLYDPDPESFGTTNTRAAGFMSDAGAFDAAFFGISPREATAMDPQQRLLLETAWEALEHAFVDPHSLRGTDVGVFTGVISQNYAPHTHEAAPELEGYLLTGNAPSVASGRLSYTFGFEGPAITVDTACSSSLVAVHLAMQALRRGECSLALAGGAAVMATPGLFIEFSRQRGLAPDGRCKSFAASADGTSWGEGAGLVLLERLSDAKRSGHRVLAVVRGSAVNQDGASNGLTAPNGSAQQRVIRQALAEAELSPSDIDVVEAHGTGTVLGDPIEAQALLATYGQDRPAGQPMWLGSLKSNIGHTQAAAGVAGVIKMVEAMRHGVLPRTLHVDEPSPHVDWNSGSVALLTERIDWPTTGRPRRAGVSSFGISGTNVHVILEQIADEPTTPATEDRLHETLAWPLSAKTEPALQAQAAQLRDLMLGGHRASPASIAQTLARRTTFDHRAVVMGAGHSDFLKGLQALAQGERASDLVMGKAGRGGKTAFVFPGQGSQWPEMATSLFQTSGVFREHFLACDEALRPYLGRSLVDVLQGTTLDQDEVIQPALFAVMVSLAELWRDHGVQPDAVIGHSQGEIAAAHVAGGLTLPDAARLVALRSQRLAALAGQGAMASIALAAHDVRTLIADRPLHLAAFNGPRSTVVSGDSAAISKVVGECAAAGVGARIIPISYASHSPYVESVRDDLLREFAALAPQSSAVAFYSTVVAGPVDTAELGPEYWYRNLREPVAFDPAIGALLRDGYRLFVEPSPHPVLTTGIQDRIECSGSDAVVLGTLRRGEGTDLRFLTSLAEAHVHGATVTWRPPRAPLADLPTYPFQHRHFWIDHSERGGSTTVPGRHYLLEGMLDLANGQGMVLTGSISLGSHPWLADHEVLGSVILPGAAFVDLALHAAARVGCARVDDLVIEAPLILSEFSAVDLQVTVEPADGNGTSPITIYSRPDNVAGGSWTRHVSSRAISGARPALSLSEWPPPGGKSIDVTDLYQRLAERGFVYGPTFQGLHAAWLHGDEFFVEISLPQETESAGFSLHPALLDAALHVAALETGQQRVPYSWSGISLHGVSSSTVRARVSPLGEGTLAIVLADASGAPIAEVESLVTRPVPRDLTILPLGRQDLLHVEWIEVEAAQPRATDPPVQVTDLRELLSSQDDTADVLGRTHHATSQLLSLIQEWLADERRAGSRLVILTQGAIATKPTESVDDLAGAAVWGMLRTAQAENPGRFALLDVDGTEPSLKALPAALATDEPQLALRAGITYRPVLSSKLTSHDAPRSLDPEGTVLITGGTGALGALVAHHLASRHHIRHILVVSRSGERAPGAARLQADLAKEGATTTFTRSDVADRAALAAILAGIPPDRPLTAVIHCAGTIDDGILTSLTQQRLRSVLRPKIDAAWHLHKLTQSLDLSAFVLFSSAAGTVGSPGQANYASANAFLDGLAHHRRSLGLPAVSLAWGAWTGVGGMADRLGDADRTQMSRKLLKRVTAQEGLELLDQALALNNPVSIPLSLNMGALRDLELSGLLPAMFNGLLPTPSRHHRLSGAQLADLPDAERFDALLELVNGFMWKSLGSAVESIPDEDITFPELGFNSINATELRNQLNSTTGLQLPVDVVYEHATPRELAGHINDMLTSKHRRSV